MGDAQRVGDLEIVEDLAFQRREWALQRVLWGGIAVVLLAALAGLLGSGPLSYVEAATSGLVLEYERLARRHAPHELTVEIGPGAATDGRVALWVDEAFLDAVRIESIMPEPEAVAAGAGRAVFHVAVDAPDAPVQVVFALQPEQTGPIAGRLGLVGGPELAFGQFVFP